MIIKDFFKKHKDKIVGGVIGAAAAGLTVVCVMTKKESGDDILDKACKYFNVYAIKPSLYDNAAVDFCVKNKNSDKELAWPFTKEEAAGFRDDISKILEEQK